MDWHIVTTEACNLHCTYCLNNDFRENSKLSWTSEDFQRLLDKTEGCDQENMHSSAERHPTKGKYPTTGKHPTTGKYPTTERHPTTGKYPSAERHPTRGKYPTTGPNVLFYGGEPLLNVDMMKRLMDEIEGIENWSVTTNGTLLEFIPDEVLFRLDAILVSIDGREATTDRKRGEGTYQRAVAGARSLRQRGWSGDLIARMTVSEHSDIEKDLIHLIDLKVDEEDDNSPPLFNHFHWQLNALWNPEPWQDFKGWVADVYNPGIDTLIDYFMANLRAGVVIGIAPFTGLLSHLLDFQTTCNPAGMHCRSGLDAAALFPDGRITACPTAPDLFSLGNITGATESMQGGFAEMEGVCAKCEVLDHCGGRCLVANRFLREEEDFPTVCTATKHYIRALEGRIPEIMELISEGVVDFSQLDAPPPRREDGTLDLSTLRYPLYNNSIEIIP